MGMIKHNQAGFHSFEFVLFIVVCGFFFTLIPIAKTVYNRVHNAGYSVMVSWAAAFAVEISPVVLAMICGFGVAIFVMHKYSSFTEAWMQSSVTCLVGLILVYLIVGGIARLLSSVAGGL